jgi:hypothetical protein
MEQTQTVHTQTQEKGISVMVEVLLRKRQKKKMNSTTLLSPERKFSFSFSLVFHLLNEAPPSLLCGSFRGKRERFCFLLPPLFPSA